ncbi:MAG: arginine--tRNA ligase, partial [Nitrososphaeria archaeon]|nr:arginine--tRNA ligase [Nitrososphaeria archaeon]
AYCGDTVYVEVNKRLASQPGLQEKKSKIAREIEEGVPETSRFNRMIAERVLADQLKTCWRLGASYEM